MVYVLTSVSGDIPAIWGVFDSWGMADVARQKVRESNPTAGTLRITEVQRNITYGTI